LKDAKALCKPFYVGQKTFFPGLKKKKKKKSQKPLMCMKQCGPALKISYHSDESFAPTDRALVSPSPASSALRCSPAFPACSRSVHKAPHVGYTTRATLRSTMIHIHFAQVQTPSLREYIPHHAILLPCIS